MWPNCHANSWNANFTPICEVPAEKSEAVHKTNKQTKTESHRWRPSPFWIFIRGWIFGNGNTCVTNVCLHARFDANIFIDDWDVAKIPNLIWRPTPSWILPKQILGYSIIVWPICTSVPNLNDNIFIDDRDMPKNPNSRWPPSWILTTV